MYIMPPVFNAGDTVYFYFDTYDSNGASVTITGLAVTDIEVYKNGSVTQRSSDSGYALLDTDGIDFDGTTGLHGFSIDTSDNTDASFWVDGAQYLVNVNAITCDSRTVSFSYMLTLGYLLRPTTAGRKLDVSSGGEAGVDWANVGSPTTTLALTGTTIATTQKVDVETIKTNPVVNGGTITFPTTATLASTTNITAGTVTTATNVTTVNGLAANVITATAIQDNAITAAKIADGAIDAASFAAGAIDATAMNVTGSEFTAIPWNAAWDAEVQSEVQDAIEANRLDELLNADSDIDGAAPPTVGSVFHELMSKTAGSFTFDQTTDSCEAIRDRGDAAWITASGFSTLDAAGVRTAVGLASANLDTQLGVISTDTTTDIPALIATLQTYVDTEVAAIKAKTDNLPSDPADASDVAAAITAAWTTALTESYATDGSTATPAQLLYMILCAVSEFSISGTTITGKKLDGSTTAMTWTLDDSADPTSRTRAS